MTSEDVGVLLIKIARRVSSWYLRVATDWQVSGVGLILADIGVQCLLETETNSSI